MESSKEYREILLEESESKNFELKREQENLNYKASSSYAWLVFDGSIDSVKFTLL